MENLIDVKYEQTGASTSTDTMGMREMQAQAFDHRNEQYLLLKAPPASGKSRALMFLGLDKLFNQGVKKVIVAVPERSIASSFAPTNLTDAGFFADWDIEDHNNLCTPGSDEGKVQSFIRFLKDENETTLVCTHSTLRFVWQKADHTLFSDVVLAIDEFHHVSASEDSKLGELLRGLMNETNAHIIAMTGSYFRGDAIPVLDPRDEAKFTNVTYNYYQQLNGYTWLKSLGIGYHFYQGKYTSAVHEVLDTDKKTILHIPHVMSGESTKDKLREVDEIIDSIGVVVDQSDKTGIITVKRPDGKLVKVADLVNDEPQKRNKVVEYLRSMHDVDDLDLIIALGMAKEGFDWPWCEHALTVGYRGSLTEVIQIIGRCTRDSPNKTHAQFTNLIAAPDAEDDEVKVAVNNMLKAITSSLLMEQVVAPNFTFKQKKDESDKSEGMVLKIKGFKEPTSDRVRNICETDLNDLKAKLFQDQQMLKAMPGNVDPEVMNKVLIPRIIRTAYPDLSDTQIEEVRQQVVVDSVIKNSEIKEVGGRKFVLMSKRFVNIEDLNIDLIDTVNPFQRAYEILSKSVTAQTLARIQEAIDFNRVEISEEEVRILWPKIQAFRAQHGIAPSIRSADPPERRMAEALLWIKKQRKEAGL